MHGWRFTRSFGTVFDLMPQKNGGWKENLQHIFAGGKNGSNRSDGVIFDSAGNLYGTACR